MIVSRTNIGSLIVSFSPTTRMMSTEWTNKTGRPFNEDRLEILAILDADQAIADKEEDKKVLEEGRHVSIQARAVLVGRRPCLLKVCIHCSWVGSGISISTT